MYEYINVCTYVRAYIYIYIAYIYIYIYMISGPFGIAVHRAGDGSPKGN